MFFLSLGFIYLFIFLTSWNFIPLLVFSLLGYSLLWRSVLVKIMTIQLHRKSILIQLQQILWTCCVFLSSLKNTFFSVLVIIFSNKSYFCFNYRNTFFYSCHELFFSGTSNYFSNVYRELFFNWAENYFIFWSTMHCGPCIWSGLVRVFDFLGRPFWKLCKWRSAFKENAKAKHCKGKKRKRFSSFLQNLSGASSLSLVMRFSGPKI